MFYFNNGELSYVEVFDIFCFNIFSCPGSDLKYGWSRACSAVILYSGFTRNIFLSKSRVSLEIESYNSPSRVNVQALFSANTS